MANLPFLNRYLRTGMSDDNDYETNRRVFMVNLFGLVGICITFLMATGQLLQRNWVLTAVLYLASVVYYLGHLYQKNTGNFDVASNIILFSLFLLMFYLIHTGGVANTGPLWIFMVAPVSLFFDGLVKGIRDIAFFVLVITIMLFTPDNMLLATSYTMEFKTRLLYSFLTVSFLSAFYEYSRQQSFQFMQHMTDKYEQLAKLDPLTKLSNRRDAMDKINYELRAVDRNNSSIALILCDIDHFKKINDIYGHEIGDNVLITLSEAFNETLRKQDTVCRWGGEEFLFILPKTTALQAQIVANKLRDKVNDLTMQHDNNTFRVTVSMGVSEMNKHQKDITAVMNEADKHLYQAKAAGRDCIYPLAPASSNESLQKDATA